MFNIEYQKGCNLSCIILKLNTETMKSILDGFDVGTMERADAHDPVVAQADEEIHKPIQETVILTQAACIELHVTDWVTTQQEDPALKAVIK